MTSKKRKKVLFLITKSNWGGAQRYVYDIATNLDKNVFESVVVLGGDGPLKERLYHAGVKTITISSLKRDVSLAHEIEFSKALWGILKSEKPDILHVNSSKAGAIGTLLGRVARIKRVIFTAHGWAFNEDRPFIQKLLIKCIHYLTVLFSHKTIAVSKSIINEMNWPFVKNKMKLIYPGRTIGAMYPKIEAREHIIEYNPHLASVKNNPWIMTIAELHPTKQINVVIEAFSKIPAMEQKLILVIIGDGQEKDSLVSLVTEKGLQEKIFFTGAITEAARFLKAADLFVLPSRSEAYGYVVHEAALASVPVVVSNVGGLREIVIDKQSGRLFESGDVRTLASIIANFMSEKDIWSTYAQNAHQHLKERSVAKMTIQTQAIYTLPLNQ